MSSQPLQLEGYRISAAQKRLWNLGARGRARTSIARVALASPMDRRGQQQAVDALVARHEIFRTTFHRLAGMDLPLQVILDRAPCEVQWHDHEPSLDVLRDAVARRPLPADRSLLELHAVADQPVLIAVAPALIADRFALELVLAELAAGDAAEPQLQYVQYSEWLHETQSSAEAADALKAWSASAGVAGLLPFQCEAVAPPDEEAEVVARTVSVSLPVGREEAVLLAAAAAALRMRTDAVRIDVERRGRGFDELSTAPGPYAEFLPLRIVFDDDASIDDLLSTLDAQQPFFDRERIDGRDTDRLPIGFRYRTSDSDSDAERFDLLIDVVARAGVLELRALYSPTRHRRETIARMLDSMALALTSSEDEQLLGDEELRALAALNETDVVFPRAAATLDVLFRAVASERAGAPAVWCDGRELTFAELDRLANAIANVLRARGIGRGHTVCVIATRSVEQIASIVGIWKAGAAYVAVDPDNPPARKAVLVEAIGATAVLTNGDAIASLPPLAVPVIDACGAEIAGGSHDAPPSVAGPRDAAYVIFTSGTTGVPKGVVVEHRSAVNLAEALRATVYEGEGTGLRVSVNAPLTFDSSVKQLLQLVNGHCLCIVPEESRTDGELLIEWLRRSHVDVFDCTPSHIRFLYAAGLGEIVDLPVRRVLVGGERIDRELWDQLAAHPSIRFYNAYGPTETTVNVSIEPITHGTRAALGRPLPNVRVHILDDDQRPVPFGVAGEICIGGAGVSRGYFGRAALTAEKFVPEPGRRGARMYRSGDRGRLLADGRIEFLGRTDDQVKIRGFRIEPAEIEALLARHPHVGRAAVVPRADGGDLRLVAYVSRERETIAGSGALARLPIGIDVAELNRNETSYLFEEIFVKRSYVQHSIALRDDAVVFDVGANIGMFTLFVSRECARPRIYAFEPIAPIFEKLEWNAGRHGTNVKVFPFGLSTTEHEETFTFYPGYSMMSSQLVYADAASEREVIQRYLQNERQQGLASRELLLDHIDELLENRFRADAVPARLRRLSDVIREEGVTRIDLLKIDVQRAEELDVISGIDDEHWPLIQQVVMEVHDGAGSPTQGRTGELLELLERRGFDVVIEQDVLLQGTDRFNLYAVRPAYVAEHAASGAPQLLRDPLSTSALRAFLLEHLPEHLVPSSFVVMDALPVNRHGKVDRAALPAPDAARPELEHELVVPENWQEEALVAIWREVLSLDSVGVTDNFFQLGGDSIRSIQVQALAQKQGLRVPLQKLFVHQTIRELVRGTDLAALPPPAAAVSRPVSLPAGVEDMYPLSALQEGMLYHSELTGDARTYHNATTHRIDLPLEYERLVAACQGLVDAHPILRASFALSGYEQPMLIVHRAVDVPIPVTDLSSMSDPDRSAAIDAAVARELATPFEFAGAPLFRLHAFRTAPNAFELLLTEYHAVLDGWSRHLFLTELLQRYERALGRPVVVPDPPRLSGRRLIELQQDAMKSDGSRTFWRALLDGIEPTSLPGDAGTVAREIRMRHVPLPAGVTASLRAAAQSEGVPLKSLLLSIYARVLAAMTGSEQPLAGVVMNVRPEEAEGDRVLGLFLNTLPFPMRTRGASWAALARQAFELEQRIVPHRFVPLAEVQRLAGGRRLFDAFFNFTHFYGAGESPMSITRVTPVDVAFRLAVDFELDGVTGELSVYFQYDATSLGQTFAADLTALLRTAIDTASRQPHAPALLETPRIPAPSPEPPRAQAPAVYVEPRTPLERDVAAVWREVLRVERVGATDMFVDVGGHSLLATQIVIRLREKMGCKLPLSVFCETATVAGLAQFIARERGRA